MKLCIIFSLFGFTSGQLFGQPYVLRDQFKKSNILKITDSVPDSSWMQTFVFGGDSLLAQSSTKRVNTDTWIHLYLISDTVKTIYHCEYDTTKCTIVKYYYSKDGKSTGIKRFSYIDTIQPSTVTADYVRDYQERIIAYKVFKFYKNKSIVEKHSITYKRNGRKIIDHFFDTNGNRIVSVYWYSRMHYLTKYLSYFVKPPIKKTKFCLPHAKHEIQLHLKYKNDEQGNWIKSYYINGIRKQLRSIRTIEYRE